MTKEEIKKQIIVLKHSLNASGHVTFGYNGKLIFIDDFLNQILKAIQSKLPTEVKDIINCIIRFDRSECLEVKGKYFEVIQKDLIRAMKLNKYGFCDIPNCNNPASKFFIFCREHK